MPLRHQADAWPKTPFPSFTNNAGNSARAITSQVIDQTPPARKIAATSTLRRDVNLKGDFR
jgi:hypothetical protein